MEGCYRDILELRVLYVAKYSTICFLNGWIEFLSTLSFSSGQPLPSFIFSCLPLTTNYICHTNSVIFDIFISPAFFRGCLFKSITERDRYIHSATTSKVPIIIVQVFRPLIQIYVQWDYQPQCSDKTDRSNFISPITRDTCPDHSQYAIQANVNNRVFP